MNKYIIVLAALLLAACNNTTSQEKKDAKTVQAQQSQYAIGQPVPLFNWSLERHIVAELYKIRNQKAATHSVWRSDRGMIEGDCPSMGFGVPYDTSLTNPLVAYGGSQGRISIEQAEPNGVFASKNTSATWVLCVGDAGILEPIYIETKVTVYPFNVKVDYDKNRVTKAGKATVIIKR